MIGDDLGGAHFLIAQFGMLVKIPSPFDDFGLYPLGFLVNAGKVFRGFGRSKIKTPIPAFGMGV